MEATVIKFSENGPKLALLFLHNIHQQNKGEIRVWKSTLHQLQKAKQWLEVSMILNSFSFFLEMIFNGRSFVCLD